MNQSRAFVLLLLLAGCHHAAARRPDPPRQTRPPSETPPRQVPPREVPPGPVELPDIPRSTIIAFFRDTLGARQMFGDEPTHDVRSLEVRDSLRPVVARERDLWHATGMTDYWFLLRVGCFCP